MLDLSLGELDFLWYRWEEELLLVRGGKQREGEPVVDYLHRVDAVFKFTICEPLWGLPKKQVLFVRKYMNEVWRQLSEF